MRGVWRSRNGFETRRPSKRSTVTIPSNVLYSTGTKYLVRYCNGGGNFLICHETKKLKGSRFALRSYGFLEGLPASTPHPLTTVIRVKKTLVDATAELRPVGLRGPGAWGSILVVVRASMVLSDRCLGCLGCLG